jgi:hypothetical protein
MKSGSTVHRKFCQTKVIHDVDFDAELQRHNELLRRACRIGRTDRVLDIGCERPPERPALASP